MPAVDYTHMTPTEKLDLIGEIWDSIEAEAVPLTESQATEVERRLATLDEDIEQGQDAFEVLAEFRARHR